VINIVNRILASDSSGYSSEYASLVIFKGLRLLEQYLYYGSENGITRVRENLSTFEKLAGNGGKDYGPESKSINPVTFHRHSSKLPVVVRIAAAKFVALISDDDRLRSIRENTTLCVDPSKRVFVLDYQVLDKPALSSSPYTKKYFWLSEEPMAISVLKSTDAVMTRTTAAWASQTGIGLLYYADAPDKRAQPKGVLCLAHATEICGPYDGWFSFTMYGLEHRFRSAHDQLSGRWWAVFLGKAIAEANGLRPFVEDSHGYREFLRNFDLRPKNAANANSVDQSRSAAPSAPEKASGHVTTELNEGERRRQLTEELKYFSKQLRLSHADLEPSCTKRPLESHAPNSLNLERLSSNPDDTPEEPREGCASSPRINLPNENRSEVSPPTSTPKHLIPVPASPDREQNLSMRLDPYFAQRRFDQDAYTDLEIQEIAEILTHQNPRWSRVPRTYVVLRNIGHLDLLDHCIDVGFSDYWFPVTERTLPELLRPSVRAAFVEAQNLVLTESVGLEKGGKHCNFKKGEMLPFEMKGVLGSGGYGQVDRVLSLISFREYARKRVPRSAFRGRKKEDFKQFIAEIEILKRLQHRHVVEFVGSYTDSKYIGLIMSPIADHDLSAYLAQASSTSINRPELRTFFGCLATALEYLHSNNVRHKDIKPGNVLVSNGKVLLADFGLSFDFTDAPSTTMSMVNGMTPRYCAPEVAAHEARNTMSDIWCLGVVFLEMIVVLKGETLQDMDAFLRQHGGFEQPFVRLNIAALPALIAHLKQIGQSTDNRALDWTEAMLSVPQKARPTASALVTQIVSPLREEYGAGFCGICCMMPEEEDFSDSSTD
jgi:hypothetical protein